MAAPTRSRRPLAKLAAAGLGAGAALGAALSLVDRTDQRRIAADPEWLRLNAPLDGRERKLEAPDGTQLHVEVFGAEDAPPIVLAHGWMCALRFWRYQIEALAKDFRVIAYDQRGHARSAAASGGDYSIEALGDDLQAVLEAEVQQGERAILAGHSMGAMTIAAWAGRHTGDVRKRARGVALVNTGLGDLITESRVIRTPARLDNVRQRIGHSAMCTEAPFGVLPRAVFHRGVRFVALGPAATPAQVDFCERMLLECRPAARGACGGTMSAMQLHDAIDSLELPTVLVASERDRLTPPAHARRLAERLPQLVDLIALPAAGHMGPLEAPAEVTDALRALA